MPDEQTQERLRMLEDRVILLEKHRDIVVNIVQNLMNSLNRLIDAIYARRKPEE